MESDRKQQVNLSQQRRNDKISKIRKRCRLNHAFEMWCIAFAAISQWLMVNEHLDRLLRRTFSGWHQTRINEKGNKVLRDAARTDNASKVAMMSKS